MNEKVLTLEGVSKIFSRKNIIKTRRYSAVQDLDLNLFAGKTLGLIGASGSGKTTTARIILGLTKPTTGRVLYRGQDISLVGPRGLKDYRKKVQGLFQDTTGTLDPRMTVGASVMEILRVNGGGKSVDLKERRDLLFGAVQLDPEVCEAYPHELSGGQKQRVCLARCLALKPEILVCDEPVAALDISSQAQVLKLFIDLQVLRGMSYLFISHDMRVVRYVSHMVAVMYRGRLVELGPAEVLFKGPLHPYTRLLLASMPRLEELNGGFCEAACTSKQREASLTYYHSRELESLGCPYSVKCPWSTGTCRISIPPMREMGEGHWVRCFESFGNNF